MIEFNNVELLLHQFSLLIKDLCFPQKGIVMIEGDNGSGKSSLFKLLMKIHLNYSGDIFINQQNIRQLSAVESSQLISYVPQISTTLPHITGKEFLDQGLYLNGENRLEELVDFFGAHPLLTKNCYHMSGGEKQLCTIIRNLAIKKNIIILDEADSFLSKKNKALLVTLISQLALDNLILMSTHQPNLYHVDHLYKIDEINDNIYQIFS